jgi:hypothetical protein
VTALQAAQAPGLGSEMKKTVLYQGLVGAAVAMFSIGCGGSSREEEGTIAVGEPCTEEEKCVPSSICFEGFCVGEGDLRISLAFVADSDFDLHVMTPQGSEIYFANPIADGGELDVDQCVGVCDDAPVHVENVVFANPAPGTYLIWVENFDGRAAGTFDIEVAGNVSVAFAGELAAVEAAPSEQFAIQL